MWITLTLLLMIGSGALVFFFKNKILKTIYTALGRPYFKVNFRYFRAGPGGIYVDAFYNNFFIYELERIYTKKGDGKVLEPLSDDEKILVYLYDLIADQAEEIIPQGEINEFGEEIPMLAYRGGEEVRQVVDIAKETQKPGSKVDFVG